MQTMEISLKPRLGRVLTLNKVSTMFSRIARLPFRTCRAKSGESSPGLMACQNHCIDVPVWPPRQSSYRIPPYQASTLLFLVYVCLNIRRYLCVKCFAGMPRSDEESCSTLTLQLRRLLHNTPLNIDICQIL